MNRLQQARLIPWLLATTQLSASAEASVIPSAMAVWSSISRVSVRLPMASTRQVGACLCPHTACRSRTFAPMGERAHLRALK